MWKKPNENLQVVQIVSGQSHTLYLTADSKVYISGNIFSDSIKKIPNPGTTKLLKQLAHEKISMMATGSNHALFLTENGHVYSWGENQYGQLGLGHFQKQYTPQLIQALTDQKIVAIFAGDSASFCITKAGLVYSFGWSAFGQLGLPPNCSQSYPSLVVALRETKITAIASGFNHTLFLSESGEVYGSGEYTNGKLGTNFYVTKPTLIKHLSDKKVIMVAAGHEHSLCLTNEGKVYGFGSNANGQLGLDKIYTNSKERSEPTPVLITRLQNEFVTAIAAGHLHTLCQTKKGSVYSFGDNDKGQLGHNLVDKNNTPQKISIPFQMNHISRKNDVLTMN